MSHCNTDKFNYFWIFEPLARCAKRGSRLPLGTPMEIDFSISYLHYPLPQCSKIVTPIIFSTSYELFRLPSAKVPQDYQLLRTFVWKSWPGTMGHFLRRLLDSPKYLITLRSNISPCQKATTLILIPLYNPLFHLWKASKIFLGTAVFCLGCLLKSATVTSFSQLHLSRNSGSRRSLDQVNLHFIAHYTRWLIKNAKKCEKLSRFLVGMENFTLKEIHVARRNVG